MHKVKDAIIHPSSYFDHEFDIAVLILEDESHAQPAILYEGGDLGITDCKRMQLSYLSWGTEWMPAEAGSASASASGSFIPPRRRLLSQTSESPSVSMVKLYDHKDCQHKYHQATGSVYHELGGMGSDGAVGKSEICVVTDPKDAEPTGPCHGDMGLPLTARVKGRAGSMLLGLAHKDHCSKDVKLPAVFTRISSSLQWIRATVPQLGAYPRQFDIELDIMELGLPEGAHLHVYSGPNLMDHKLVEDGMLDSKCQVPWQTSTHEGAMLLVLSMPEEGDRKSNCDHECVDTMGFTAKFGLAECPECTANCTMSVTWDRMGPEFEDKGKGYTGGLGKRMVKRVDREYGVWACVRDWDAQEQMACGARNKELACFWFEEKSRYFEFKGLNEKTRLVTAAQYEHGMRVEDGNLRGRTLATSPDQAHL